MIEFEVRAADAVTKIADLKPRHIVDGSMLDEVEGEGTGTVTIGLEADQQAVLNERGRVIVWHGTEDAAGDPFMSLIESNEHVALASGRSLAQHGVTVAGRSLLAQWEDVRVHQWPTMNLPGQKYFTRHFNYASPGKAAAINGTAYDHGAVLDYDSAGQPNQPDRPPPDTWRSPWARRLWGTPFSLDVPNETCLLRRTFTTGAAERILRTHATADDRILCWIGGVPMLQAATYPDVAWHDTWASSTETFASTQYDFVACCRNEYTAPGGSAAWAAVSVWALPFVGSGLSPDTLRFVSEPTNWRALVVADGTPTPTWIAPEILAVLVAEWQPSRLTGWEVVDMAAAVGVPHRPLAEVTFETERTTGLDVLRQFIDSGIAEFRARVRSGKKQLLVFPAGTVGNFHTSPGSPHDLSDGRVVDLSHRWGTQ